MAAHVVVEGPGEGGGVADTKLTGNPDSHALSHI